MLDNLRGRQLPKSTNTYQRVRLGIEYGVSLGVVLILFAGGVWLSSDTPPLGPVSFGQLTFYYLVGGTLGGGIGGALYPMAGSRVGAAFLGVVSLLPFQFMLIFTLAGFQDVPRVAISSVLASVVLGGPCGIAILYRAYHRRNDD